MPNNIARLAAMNEALTNGLAPAVQLLLLEARRHNESFSPRLPRQCNPHQLDAHAALYAIVHNWDSCFRRHFSRSPSARSAASSALDGRNAMAHPISPPSDSLTQRALLGALELLKIVGADVQAEMVAQQIIGSAVAQSQSGRSAQRQPTHSKPIGDVEFWVYENWTHKKAIIHLGSCSYCNNGNGMHGNNSGRNDKWHGTFDDYEAAFKRAEATRQPDVRPCGKCRPDMHR